MDWHLYRREERVLSTRYHLFPSRLLRGFGIYERNICMMLDTAPVRLEVFTSRLFDSILEKCPNMGNSLSLSHAAGLGARDLRVFTGAVIWSSIRVLVTSSFIISSFARSDWTVVTWSLVTWNCTATIASSISPLCKGRQLCMEVWISRLLRVKLQPIV